MPTDDLCETELYQPIKSLLEGQGYVVKSEIGAVDVMALADGADEPVIVELKTGFSLSLFQQAVARTRVTDCVYIAVPKRTTKAFRAALRSNLALCRRLGLGLILVRLRDGFCEVLADPGPYRPRKSKSHKKALLREFAKRLGDPNKGGATRSGLMTAYRQDALRCVAALQDKTAAAPRYVAQATGVTNARNIMADNHYGWFVRVSRGVYALSPKGLEAATTFNRAMADLRKAG